MVVKECSVTNFLGIMTLIFQQEWPLKTRRWNCFEYKQGKSSWTSWYPKLRLQFIEAQMEKMTVEGLQCLIIIKNTENPKIKEELLKLKGEDLVLKNLSEVGKQWELAHAQRAVPAESNRSAGVNYVQGGASPGPRNGAPKRELVCFVCVEKGHPVRLCNANKLKLKCTACVSKVLVLFSRDFSLTPLVVYTH